METEISLLIKLQNYDSHLDELSEKITSHEKSVKDKNSQIESLRVGSKTAKENLAALQLKKKQLEGEADNQEKLVKKHQSELNSLKTNDAYKAMLGEIEAAKKAQTKVEDDILVVMEQLDAAEKKIKEVESKLKSDESMLKSDIQKIEAEKTQILSQHQTQQAERDAYAGTIPAAVRRQYDSLRKTRGGVAIVSVVNNACSGCHLNMPQGKVVEIRIAKHMVLCDSCSRILYIPAEEKEAVVASSETPVTPPPSA